MNCRKRQKLKLRKGPKFSKTDMYNLDCTLARIIAKGVGEFKERTAGYPSDLKSMDEWYDILDEIIWAMEHVEAALDLKLNNFEEECLRNGIRLFADRFCDLWY